MVEFFVPWLGGSTNDYYTGMHWNERKKEADAGHLATLVAVRQEKIPPQPAPVHLVFAPIVGKGVRRLDPSNYSIMAKIIEDGLIRAGTIEGDGPDQVLSILHVTPQRGEHSGVMVKVIPG